MASLEVYGLDENGSLVKITIGGDTELVLTGSCVLATSTTAPPGTLIADGSEVSRQAYSKLFAAIGTDYGEGDGETTFALPDWRDEFPRFSGAERAVGTKQSDAIRNITGAITSSGQSSGSTILMWGSAGMAYHAKGNLGTSVSSNTTNVAADITNFDASRVVPTANENRPRNVAFLPCIVYL